MPDQRTAHHPGVTSSGAGWAFAGGIGANGMATQPPMSAISKQTVAARKLKNSRRLSNMGHLTSDNRGTRNSRDTCRADTWAIARPAARVDAASTPHAYIAC